MILSDISKAIMMSINRGGKTIIFKKQRSSVEERKLFLDGSSKWTNDIWLSGHQQKAGFDSTSIIQKNLYLVPTVYFL